MNTNIISEVVFVILIGSETRLFVPARSVSLSPSMEGSASLKSALSKLTISEGELVRTMLPH